MSTGPDQEDPVLRLARLDTAKLPEDGGEEYNRLVFQKSPYLLQHAENPIDWYPWGAEAFARARSEDRPVFLSIGYSTCHWCHVMEEESFEKEEVARVLNRHFVSIKVDREERPDLDATYMAACQMMTGSGGWPLNLILSPDQRPFFAATYLPRTSRGGLPGLVDLLEKVAQIWRSDRSRLLQTCEQVQQALVLMEERDREGQALDDSLLQTVLRQYRESFDAGHAGFGGAPKFPAPHNLSLLLRLWKRTGDESAREMALQTLRRIRLGGIFDQIGFGIHRYSVDAAWLVPHFEKMLYDQALAALAFLEAFQASGDGFHAQAAREILTYAERDLGHPEGGFYCGEDADSEGAEGTFYLWGPEEVEKLLGKEAAVVFCRCYDITEGGNFEGRNIPHLDEDVAQIAERVGVDTEMLAEMLAQGRNTLFEARRRRVRPHRDEKVLTGWNGLMIAALARAGAVLDEASYVDLARKTAAFVLKRLRDDKGRLLRRYCLGEAAIPAFLEDYAFLVHGLIELYMSGFDPGHLRAARDLTVQMEALFGDGTGGLFDTGSDGETVLTRGRSLQDGAIPSGTSVAALNLLRVGRLTGDREMEHRGERLVELCLPRAAAHPQAFAQFLIALDYALGPKTDVVLVPGKDGEIPSDLLLPLRSGLYPRTVVLLKRPGDRQLEGLSPLAKGKEPAEGKSTAYLCRDESCRPPVTDAKALERLLEE